MMKVKHTYIYIFLIAIVLIASATAYNVNLKDWVKVQIADPVESNGGIPVNLQDQTTRPLDLFFIKLQTAPTTLAANATFNETTLNLTTATGCSTGDYLGLLNTNFFFGEITAINGNIVTVDSPLNDNFTAGDDIICTTREMNVDGDPDPQVFIVSGAGSSQNFSIDITRLIIEMTCTTAPDFTDFCDITNGLTNGIVLRKQDGDAWNIWNIKSNAEMGNLMFDLNVLEETRPLNTNGIIGRYTFAGQDKHGVAVRLAPGDRLEIWIQDDISSLVSFRVVAEGHVVTD